MTQRGTILAVGSTWNKDKEHREQRIVTYSAAGDYIMDNGTMENPGGVFVNIVENEPGRYMAVGYLEKKDRRRGFLELWGPFMGSPDTFLTQHKTDWDTEFQDVAPMADGGFMVVGVKKDKEKGRYTYLLKFNRKGKKQWEKLFRDYDDAWPRRILAHDGGFIIHGSVVVNGDREAWLMKVDASGNPLWDETHGGEGWQAIIGLKPLPDGNGFMGVGYNTGNAWVVRLNNQGGMD